MFKRKREQIAQFDASTKTTLHTTGFVILPNFIDIPENVKTSIQRQSERARPIFGPDRKRRQATMYSRSKYMKRFQSQLNDELDRVISDLSDNYVRDSWQILKSYTGCRR